MGRNRPIPPFIEWTVLTSPIGRWVIVDPEGNEVFKHPDRLERVHAFYLASQAPALKVAVDELSRTVEYLTAGGNHGFKPLLEFAYCTISLAKPPAAIVTHVEPVRHQQDLDLEAA